MLIWWLSKILIKFPETAKFLATKKLQFLGPAITGHVLTSYHTSILHGERMRRAPWGWSLWIVSSTVAATARDVHKVPKRPKLNKSKKLQKDFKKIEILSQ